MSKKIIIDGVEFDEEDLVITDFDAADYLQDEEQIELHLKRAIESGDQARIMRAFDTVARARGGLSQLAKDSGLARESLYKTLSGTRKPYFETVLKLIDANGYTLTLARKDTVQHA